MADPSILQQGQITYPPTPPSGAATPTPPSFVTPINLPPPFGPFNPRTTPGQTSTDVFCTTCIKNQHLLRENLAACVPPEHLSEKAQIAAYKEYQAQLERRYPQVCPQCAPKARQRIKQAGYMAKTQHLRRMMQKTKDGIAGPMDWEWTWRSWVLRVAGLGWWASALGQSLWHATEAMSLRDRWNAHHWGLGEDMSMDKPVLEPTFAVCFGQIAGRSRNAEPCSALFFRWMPWLLVIGLFTFLWNNKLREKYLRSGDGRMVGLRDYYLVQLVLLASRAAAWAFLGDSGTANTWPRGLQIATGAHAVMAGFILVTAMLASSIVKVDNNPRINFHIRDEDILPDVSAGARSPDLNQSHEKVQHLQSAPSPAPTSQRQRTPFSINALAPNSASTSLYHDTINPLISPLPPPSEDHQQRFPNGHVSPTAHNTQTPEADAMDWSPSAGTSFDFSYPNTTSKTSYNLRSRNPTSLRQPLAPLPNSTPLPPAPNQRMPHPRAPAAPPPDPWQPKPSTPFASSNFFAARPESTRGRGRGRGRQHRSQKADTRLREGSIASTDVASEPSTPFPPDDDDDDYDDDDDDMKTEIRRDNENVNPWKKRDVADVKPGRLFLRRDQLDTGLEGMFDEVFRLDAGRSSGSDGAQGRGKYVATGKEMFGGYDGGDDGSDEVSHGNAWVGLARVIAAVILGMGFLLGVGLWSGRWNVQWPSWIHSNS